MEWLRSKCNPEMVELLPLDKNNDIAYVKELLMEFQQKTGSILAAELLETWPEPVRRFIKVIFFLIFARVMHKLDIYPFVNSHY